MRAVICRAWGPVDDLKLEDVAPPTPGPGQLVIDIKATGVNYADSIMVAGRYQTRPPFPFSPGLETAGVVTRRGEGVTRFKTGDRVMAILAYGGFAEQALADEAETFPIPDGMPFAEAGAFPIAYISSHVAIRWQGRLEAGETLLVLGAAGGVGLTAVEIGKALGARVIAGASTPEKLEVARARGADALVNCRWHAPAKLRRSVDELTRWYAEGKLAPCVTHRLPLEQSIDAIKLLTDRKAHGKIVVMPVVRAAGRRGAGAPPSEASL